MNESIAEEANGDELSGLQWTYRLLRVTVMLVAAYWLSRTGDAFFYQGF